MQCLFQMPGREKSRHKQAARPRKQTLGIICLPTGHMLPPPPPSPPRPWQRCPTAPLSLQGGDRARQAVLTDAVTQGRPVEAGLAAHDAAVGAQAVLAPPRAADGIPVLLTLIHVCREQGKGAGTVKWGSLLAHGSGSVCQRPSALAGPPYGASLGAGRQQG